MSNNNIKINQAEEHNLWLETIKQLDLVKKYANNVEKHYLPKVNNAKNNEDYTQNLHTYRLIQDLKYNISFLIDEFNNLKKYYFVDILGLPGELPAQKNTQIASWDYEKMEKRVASIKDKFEKNVEQKFSRIFALFLYYDSMGNEVFRLDGDGFGQVDSFKPNTLHIDTSFVNTQFTKNFILLKNEITNSKEKLNVYMCSKMQSVEKFY
jgi:hypothetical protein